MTIIDETLTEQRDQMILDRVQDLGERISEARAAVARIIRDARTDHADHYARVVAGPQHGAPKPTWRRTLKTGFASVYFALMLIAFFHLILGVNVTIYHGMNSGVVIGTSTIFVGVETHGDPGVFACVSGHGSCG